ncbi:hypothetical protein G7Z17_g2392 [Cylindrodendrum hubeiense]|uniref:non-reducing end alpha-L-arabinofuranosidase n=1 Tax=Cylindrodendrum hubeiense TaxID=595255 RepID=A0A9P5HJ12_9HYPO|nr:hypothetical protein G7Z17_g2392 [Cylindrodendrum hubeiense]
MLASKLFATLLAADAVLAISLQVDSTAAGTPLSDLLHGLMFEDISNSGDGGLYSQQIRNNAFQGGVTIVDPWNVQYGDASIEYDSTTPLNDAIHASLKITISDSADGYIGIANPGYRGIVVDGGFYKSSFWIKGEFSGDVKIRLLGTTSDVEYAFAFIPVTSTSSGWTQYETDFWTTASPNGDNSYVIEFRGREAAGKTINIGYPTLFPPTFKGRENGLTKNIAESLDDLQATFLRFPGGNNLEGFGASTRWKWNETLGPLEERPGRVGTWGYANTDGLGLMEYLQWCEDMNLEPLLAVWAGLGFGAPILVGADLEPYVDDALLELEFILGDVTTAGGALRASLGHPEPYHLRFVEVGNEDNLADGCASYPQRFTQFFDAIHSAYSDLTIIASTADENCLPNPIPEGAWLDFHDYNVPENYVSQYSLFDDWDRANPILPNLIPFVNKPDGIVHSVSYHVLKMFSTNKGDVVLPVESEDEMKPVFWSANKKGDDTIIVKIANFGPDSQDIKIAIPGKSDATASYTVISADPEASNTVDNPKNVQPDSSSILGDGDGVFSVKVGQYGVAVLVV